MKGTTTGIAEVYVDGVKARPVAITCGDRRRYQ